MNRLKELRTEKRKLQKEIAEILNISQTGYSKYEVETNDIPTEVLKKLAIYYNTSIDYILCFTDTKEPHTKSILIDKDSL
ncbi:MAG: helix-turn-helix domain-containing protein [Ruminococcus sp.]|nr:helix-turn-helix domain-containing protein [Ruminococcus sp.]